MTHYVLIALAAYLIGSFPTAYLLVKLTRKKDVRQAGSGNVGAMNALRTTQSKLIGLTVLVIDLLKGLLPTWYVVKYVDGQPTAQLIVLTALVLGHVFPLWLKFKGGRGLAVAAGALLILRWELVAMWLGIWLIFFVAIRKHIVASLIATGILPLIVYFLKDTLLNNHILLMTLIVCMLIFQRHLERIPDIVEQKRQSINNGEK